MSIIENELIIEQKTSKKVIKLNTLNEIIFGDEYGKFYYLKVLDSDFIIELNKSQVNELKNIFAKFEIKIRHRHFSDKISEWFNKKIRFTTTPKLH